MTGRTPLGQLYETVATINGWSMRDVAQRITARGGDFSKSRIGQLVNADPLGSISANAIDSLALGLSVSRDRVALAAIQSMGFHISADEVTPAEAIARDENLSVDTKAALLAILQAPGRPTRLGVTG